jgi:hypothetical protein
MFTAAAVDCFQAAVHEGTLVGRQRRNIRRLSGDLK